MATYRAFAVRRVMVEGLYRTRALWTGVLGVLASFHGVILLIYVSGLVALPPAGSGLPATGLALDFQLIDYGTYLALVVFAVALTDSAILVALDRDFFHRDSLHWKWLRFPVYAMALIYDATRLSDASPSSSTTIVSTAATIGFGIAIFLAAANLLLSGSRVRDRSIRLYSLYLGIDAALFVVSVDLFGLPPPVEYLNAGAIVLSSFFFYKVTTSLSPTSHIERVRVSS